MAYVLLTSVSGPTALSARTRGFRQPGCLGTRPLALRPRLATGLPWTRPSGVVHRPRRRPAQVPGPLAWTDSGPMSDLRQAGALKPPRVAPDDTTMAADRDQRP